MAGTARWTPPAAGGSVSDTGNWTTDSGTPASPPGAGDTVLFDSRNHGPVTGGSLTGTTGIEVQGYGGDWAAGTSIPATTANINSHGTLNNAASITTLNLQNTHGGKWVQTGGTVTTARVGVGQFDIGASAVVTTLTNIMGNVTAAYNATGFTTVNMYGGSLVSARAITTENLDGGCSVRIVGSGLAVTTANIRGRSKHLHWSSGTIGTANLEVGELSIAGSPYSATITTLNGPRLTGRLVQYSDGGVAFTVTTDNRFGQEAGGSGGLGA
jgi:hypothetical protein